MHIWPEPHHVGQHLSFVEKSGILQSTRGESLDTVVRCGAGRGHEAVNNRVRRKSSEKKTSGGGGGEDRTLKENIITFNNQRCLVQLFDFQQERKRGVDARSLWIDRWRLPALVGTPRRSEQVGLKYIPMARVVR